MNLISFFTIISIAPIPIIHFVLHAFLLFWRRHATWFYLMGVITWLLFIPPTVVLMKIENTIFTPVNQLLVASAILAIFAFLLIISAVFTISPKRFFLWAVLRPKSVEQKYIRSGPYQFISHPAYFGYILVSLAAFIATGRVVMLGFFFYTLFSIIAVIVLENHEIKRRLNIEA